MGLLSNPHTRSKFTSIVQTNSSLLSIGLLLGGALWLTALVHPNYNGGTYFSENSLLPGIWQLGHALYYKVLTMFFQFNNCHCYFTNWAFLHSPGDYACAISSCLSVCHPIPYQGRTEHLFFTSLLQVLSDLVSIRRMTWISFIRNIMSNCRYQEKNLAGEVKVTSSDLPLLVINIYFQVQVSSYLSFC